MVHIRNFAMEEMIVLEREESKMELEMNFEHMPMPGGRDPTGFVTFVSVFDEKEVRHKKKKDRTDRARRRSDTPELHTPNLKKIRSLGSI